MLARMAEAVAAAAAGCEVEAAAAVAMGCMVGCLAVKMAEVAQARQQSSGEEGEENDGRGELQGGVDRFRVHCYSTAACHQVLCAMLKKLYSLC